MNLLDNTPEIVASYGEYTRINQVNHQYKLPVNQGRDSPPPIMGQLWASPAPCCSRPVRLCHYDPSANSISFHCGLVGSEHGIHRIFFGLSWMVTAF